MYPKWIYLRITIILAFIVVGIILCYINITDLEDDIAIKKEKGDNLKLLLRSVSNGGPSYQQNIKQLTLDDIFISVKTTNSYMESRVRIIIDTWFQLAKEQTWFFTDMKNSKFSNLTNGHLINTRCPQAYNRQALCCKMSVELTYFLQQNKKWFCHFDDDNYVNIQALVKILRKYNHQKDWYLGKRTVPVPVKLYMDSPYEQNVKTSHQHKTYWFATGGAGFCLSSALILKMVHLVGGGKFMTFGRRLRSPDDVTMGYIVEHLLKVPLTLIEEFHSHLEDLRLLPKDSFHNQISFSYTVSPNHSNVINLPDYFDLNADPTRFRSLYCYLNPELITCQSKQVFRSL